MEDLLVHLQSLLSRFRGRESACTPALAHPGRDWLIALALLFAGMVGTLPFIFSFYVGEENETVQGIPLRPVLDAEVLGETLSQMRLRTEDHARVGERLPVDPSR